MQGFDLVFLRNYCLSFCCRWAYDSLYTEKGNSIFGPLNRFLGWYRDIENITKEIEEINQAMDKGEASYILRYSVKCKRKFLKVEME